MFQRTVARLAAVPGARRPIIVTGVDHARQARVQLDAIGSDGVILAEPGGRDSGPALVAAALWVAASSRSGLAIAVASDHHIPDDHAFAAAMAEAMSAAESGRIVTFGVRPDHPSASYGYIRVGEPLGASSSARRVGQFVEKPRAEQAAALIAEGCLWNSGNFMFRVDVLIEECERLAPPVVACARRAVAEGRWDDGAFGLGAAFLESPRVSIDVGVMEKTDRAAVLPIDYAWSDMGAWDQVWAAAPRDEHGNVVSGVSEVRESQDCLVRAAPGMKIMAIGLNRLAIVAHGRHVLVTALDKASELKPALSALESRSARRGHFRGPADQAAALAAAPRLKAWLWEKALPLWWCFGADHRGGGFEERLAQDLAPIPADRRARVQARQTHVFAAAGLAGWPGPWAAAVEHGLDYLFQRYEREDGLFRASVDRRGAPRDGAAHLYDQAFVLLALATSAQAIPARRAELIERANGLSRAIRVAFARTDGGFGAEEGADILLADPIMHLFEAALAWVDADGGAVWSDLARELAELFLDRLLDAEGGRVAEVFGPGWRPYPGLEGRVIEPGHQFEWAWLLERWSRLSGDPRAHRAARALFAAGERGVDPETGLVLDAVLDDFSVHLASSRLWPQTERLKAALLLAASGRGATAALYASARSAGEALEAYLDTTVDGLWRDTPHASASADGEPSLASTLYHITGAILALDGAMVAGVAPSTGSVETAQADQALPKAAAS